MARTKRRIAPPRRHSTSTTACIDDVTYEVSGFYYAGTSAYFDKGFGNWLPGDPPELEDIEVRREDGTEVDFYALPAADQKFIEEQLVIAAEEEAIAAQSDDDDRRYEEYRDRGIDGRDF